jgi:hypothetical protein
MASKNTVCSTTNRLELPLELSPSRFSFNFCFAFVDVSFVIY